ncbi:lipoprotein-anchoring transpeptidase ErfK/SrfK [Microvirga lupini]|uniref:Lipoprotein-anchoring transpeptidase ErfK/SrfK n=1 Tax=Microvirga lupini TaxID=420324 RepID=A0A7W4YXM2_9HYPH|nr:L,D-transpeptidase family protein [Microvirga lupini]MBB3019384.1 lipoprotein-anchoring transpeptidase ErfK/SrfK [Microvirga lupini]
MKLTAYAALGFLSLLGPAMAAPQGLDLQAVNGAEWSPKSSKGKEINPALIKAQVLLDRARFSPGVIDGHDGENLQNALKIFEKINELKSDGALDEEVWKKLAGTSADPVLIEYTITDEDVKGPFVEIPDTMEDQAKLDRLGYSSPEELLAETFHMDVDLLKALNPDKPFDKAGTAIVVANVDAKADPGKPKEKAAKIEIVKSEKVLRALAKDGTLMATYPASIGSEEKPAPKGSHTVRAVAPNPNYTYNPDYAFKGVKAKEKFEIKPGPNNPVGSTWIDLSVESFGIHGTPEPEKVGKAYSHGCVRLTNWDVQELAGMVEKGTPVDFID